MLAYCDFSRGQGALINVSNFVVKVRKTSTYTVTCLTENSVK